MMFEIASQKPFHSIIYHFSIGNNMQKIAILSFL